MMYHRPIFHHFSLTFGESDWEGVECAPDSTFGYMTTIGTISGGTPEVLSPTYTETFSSFIKEVLL
jgi:hypothetical protein